MDMITKTYDETLATLREVVAEAGEDFVYQRRYGNDCLYSVNGEPACIVGRVLAKWGVDLTRMDSEYDGEEGSTMKGVFAPSLLVQLEREGELEVDDKSRALLREAQSRQDAECSWGESLRCATRYAERI